jgi:D-proline reductase (dithiol) PrdB
MSAPPITLDEFFTSLHHGERSNEFYGYWQYFMHASGDEMVADFLEDVLRVVKDSIDDDRWERVVNCVQRWDQRYADWFIDEYEWTHRIINTHVPWTPLPRPIEQCRLALITSGGLSRSEDEPFGPGVTPKEQAKSYTKFYERHPTFRVIPRDYPRERIRVSHASYDYSAVLMDVNVLFPLDRAEELEREGRIGELASENYSYMGMTQPERVDTELVPGLVDALRAQAVDAVLLTPG